MQKKLEQNTGYGGAQGGSFGGDRNNHFEDDQQENYQPAKRKTSRPAKLNNGPKAKKRLGGANSSFGGGADPYAGKDPFGGASAGGDVMEAPLGGGADFNDLPPEAFESASSMQPCNSCGRTFNPKALKIHSKNCKKVFIEKRKKFNVKEMRATEDMANVGNDPYANGGYGKKKKKKKAAGREIQPAKK